MSAPVVKHGSGRRCRSRRVRSRDGGSAMGSILGNRVARVEDPRMLTVGGTYVEDIALPGAAWLTYVRSPMAHARIPRIDVDEARGLPGVLGVFTGRRPRPTSVGVAPNLMPSFPEAMRRPFVADRRRALRRPAGGGGRSPRTAPSGPTPPTSSSSTTSRCPRSSSPRRRSPTRCCSSPRSAPTSCSASPRATQADFTDCEVVVEERIVNQRHDRRADRAPLGRGDLDAPTAASCTTRPARAPTPPATCWR